MSRLVRIVVERDGGRWVVTREHETGGDRVFVDDWHEAFEAVDACYHPDGVPRSLTIYAAAGGGSSSSSKAG